VWRGGVGGGGFGGASFEASTGGKGHI